LGREPSEVKLRVRSDGLCVRRLDERCLEIATSNSVLRGRTHSSNPRACEGSTASPSRSNKSAVRATIVTAKVQTALRSEAPPPTPRIVVWPKPYQARSVHPHTADVPRVHRQVHFVPTFGFMQRSKITGCSIGFATQSTRTEVQRTLPSGRGQNRSERRCLCFGSENIAPIGIQH
jgi:hypothetical protein